MTLQPAQRRASFLFPYSPISPLHFTSLLSSYSLHMSQQSPTFIVTPPPFRQTCRHCSKCSNLSSQHPQSSRRTFLHRALFSTTSLFISAAACPRLAQASDEKQKDSDNVCKNCIGTGRVPCELCSSTGFWRALSTDDPRQRYKGVVCPECEGVGSLICPVCLGTGEGKIKGLLRRRRIEPGPGRILQSN